MFRLPQAYETTSLLASYQAGSVARLTQQFAQNTLNQQRFLESITAPWVSSIEAARSVSALLELQSIGSVLKTTKGFDTELTAALRLDLGDWRDKITFPESVFIDPVARTDFYVNRGFNSSLTDFPEDAFQQCLGFADIDGDTLNIELYGSIVRPTDCSR